MPSHEQIPTDRVYQRGVPIDGSRLVTGIQLDDATPTVVQQDVDWTQPVDLNQDTAYATASATSHYHYQNVSHALLCNKVMEDAHDVPEPVRWAAELLAAQSAEDITAWGQYMTRRGGGGDLPAEQREYYQMLFQEDEVLPVLLGIQTKNIAADRSRTDFYRHGDSTFNTIAEGTVEKNEDNRGQLVQAFQKAIDPLPLDERERLLRKIAQQVDLLQILCMKRHDDIYTPLNADAERFLQNTGRQLKTFYDEIGLTQDIF